MFSKIVILTVFHYTLLLINLQVDAKCLKRIGNTVVKCNNQEIYGDFDFSTEPFLPVDFTYNRDLRMKRNVEMVANDRPTYFDESMDGIHKVNRDDLKERIDSIVNKTVKSDRIKRPQQSSLVFVFDATGSMHDDLKQLTEGASLILDTMLKRDVPPVINYILVPYRDPDVGPIVVTTSEKEMREELKNISIYGGGDCPEASLEAIQLALKESLPFSYIYVFTDASSNDPYLVERVLNLIQTKKSQVVFVLTGTCNDLDKPSYKVYEEIAEASNGQIFNLNKTDVIKILEYVNSTLEVNRVNLGSITYPEGYNHSHKVIVDDTLSRVTISVSGPDPMVTVENPQGEKLEGPPHVVKMLDLSKLVIIEIVNPETGNWTINVGSADKHTVKFSGLSEINFDSGYSTHHVDHFSKTTNRPVKDTMNRLVVKLNDDADKVKELKNVELVSVTGETIFEIPLKRIEDTDEPNLYETENFMIPVKLYYVEISGTDINGNIIRRMGPTAISPQLPDKPHVTVEKEVITPMNQNVTLKCDVESLVPVTVWWFRNNKPVQDKQTALQSVEVVHVIYNVDESSMGNYTCKAFNSEGPSSASTLVKLIVPPPKVTMYPKDVRVHVNKDLKIECLVESQTEITDVDLFFQPKDKFKRNTVHFNPVVNLMGMYTLYTYTFVTNEESEGNYVCLVTNSGGKSQSETYITILKPLKIEIYPKITEYFEGDLVIFVCNVYGTKFATWTFPNMDGKNITSTSEVTINKREENEISLTLEISKTTKFDEGVYECRAYRNYTDNEEQERSLAEMRYVEKPKIDKSKKEIVFRLNEVVILNCNTSGIPKPFIKWYLPNNSEVTSNDKNILVNENDQLIIKSIKRDEAGIYRCKVENQYGIDQGSFKIDVYETLTIDKLNNLTVNIYDVVNVPCKVNGFPEPEVFWYYNDESYILQADVVLTLTDVTLKNVGKYVCVAKNKYEEISESFHLNVLALPPRIQLQPQKSDLYLPEKDVNIICTVQSDIPILNSTLYFSPKFGSTNEKDILHDINAYLNKTAVISHKIITSHTTEGSYICEAYNKGGMSKEEVDIMVLPVLKINVSPISINFEEGDDVEFSCTIYGSKFGTWYKLGNDSEKSEMKSLSRSTENDDGIVLKMVIKNSTKEDEGSYFCEGLRNILEEESVNFTVNSVFVMKPKITKIDPNVSVEIGKSLEIDCQSDGIPIPDIIWMLPGDVEISPNSLLDDEIKVNNGKLIIENVNNGHEGIYKCLSKNLYGVDESQTLVNVWSKPIFMEKMQNKSLDIYGSINIICPVKSMPDSIISWYHNDILMKDINDSILRIDSVNIKDGGKYTCKAKNVHGEIEDDFYLDVTGLVAPKVFKGGKNVIIKEGDKIEIECRTIEGEPKPTVIWQKDNKNISINVDNQLDNVYINPDFIYLYEFNHTNNLLSIERATEEHEGNYTCIANNPIGSDEYKLSITVNRAPRFQNRFSDADQGASIVSGPIEAVSGNQVAFTCEALGNPKPMITWSKDGFPLRYTNITYTDGDDKLVISDTKETDSGLYTCYANNFLGNLQKNFTLVVLVKPMLKNEVIDPIQKFVEGQMIVLPCPVYGNPKPEVQWILNEELLVPSERIQVDIENNLRFVANLTDTGLYQCEAINKVGNVSKEYLVVVFMPPVIYPESNEVIKITPGSPATLDCHAIGFPEPNIKWSKNGEIITSNSTEMTLNDYGRLNITFASKNISGKYICNAENYAGLTQKLFYVMLNEPPYLLPSEVAQKVQLSKGEEEFYIPCKAKGNPVPYITWMKNGKFIINDFHTKVQNDGTLKLRYLTESMSGNYTCQAANSEGSIEIDYDIQIIAPPSLLNDEENIVTAIEGSIAVLECPLKPSLVTPKIEWSKNSKTLIDHVNVTKLKLENVNRSDAGEYSCYAVNPIGQTSASFTLDVHWPPRFIEDGNISNDDQLRLLEGDPLLLICNVDANPPADIQWIKDKEVLGEVAPVFKKKYAKSHHAGVHMCVASNPLGEVKKEFVVKVSAQPKIDGPEFNDIEVRLNQPVKLECIARGIPKPKIKWNGIQSSDWNIIGDGKILKTFNISLKSTGAFSCEASNDIGSTTKMFNLTVLEPPIIYNIQAQHLNTNSIKNITFDVQVKEYSPIKILCKFNGSRPFRVLWINNGKTVHEDASVTSDTSELIFNNVTTHDSGKYTCMVNNRAGSDELDILLDVLSPPHIISEYDEAKSNDLQVLEGYSIKLRCPTNGNPPPDIYWYKDNNLMRFYDSEMYTKDYGQILIMNKISKDHQGSYMCEARNSVGKDKKHFELDVFHPPIIQLQMDANLLLSTTSGKDIYLECPVSGNPKPTIRWLKQPFFDINPENNERILLQSENKEMIIKNISLAESGNYSCIATNAVGIAEMSYSVEVLVAPTLIPDDKKQSKVDDNGLITATYRRNFQLVCKVTGNPEPQITWYKDGFPIDSKQRKDSIYISLDGQYFNVLDAAISDSGKYNCKADNKVGMIDKEFKVKILVPAEWSMWSEWGQCDKNCGQGSQRRTRKCQFYGDIDSIEYDKSVQMDTADNEAYEKYVLQNRKWLPDNLLDKSSCIGETFETRECFIAPCEIDGGWSDWSEWTSCSVLCGLGNRKRYRTCTNPTPKYGGAPCKGVNNEQGPCQGNQCSEWLPWSHWSPCSVSCGKGVRMRTRVCDGPEDSCLGNSTEKAYCLLKYCPVNGGWNQWSPWSACSVTCGMGLKRRTRECDKPAPKWGGKSCKGPNLQMERCMNQNCDFASPNKNMLKANDFNVNKVNLVVSGNLNGKTLPKKTIDANINEINGQKYVNSSLQGLLPDEIDNYLPHMAFLVSPISVNDSQSLQKMSKKYNPDLRSLYSTYDEVDDDEDAEIQFSTGEKVQFYSQNQKITDSGELDIEIKIDGWMPDIKNTTIINNKNRNNYPSSVPMNLILNEDDVCSTGYTYDENKQQCVDINECELPNNNCHSTQMCENLIGGYKCLCEPGYLSSSMGQRCLDINECSQGLHNCSHECLNIPGSYYCQCPSSFYLSENKQTCIRKTSRNVIVQKRKKDIIETTTESNFDVSYESQENVLLTRISPKKKKPGERIRRPHRYNVKNDYDYGVYDKYLSPIDNEYGDFFEGETRQRISKQVTMETTTLKSIMDKPLNNIFKNRLFVNDCPDGFSLKHDKCEDIDECSANEDSCNGITNVCINTYGSFMCIPTPCPDLYHRNLRNGTCVQQCNTVNTLCSEKAVIQQSLIYITYSTSEDELKVPGEILNLNDGGKLNYTKYYIESQPPNEVFEIITEDTKGVLYVKTMPLLKHVIRVIATSRTYNKYNDKLFYFTKYIIYIYISSDQV